MKIYITVPGDRSVGIPDAIRGLAKDFVKFVTKEEDKAGAFNAWYAKLQADLAKQIKYELENELPLNRWLKKS